MSGPFGGVRFALRTLRRTPGFTAVALCVLALGIGANTLMFGLVRAFLLRPLPFDNAERLVALQQLNRLTGDPNSVVYANYLDWKQRTQSLDDLGLYHDDKGTLRVRSRSPTSCE
jgi:putative ABC transport system permease protein